MIDIPFSWMNNALDKTLKCTKLCTITSCQHTGDRIFFILGLSLDGTC